VIKYTEITKDGVSNVTKELASRGVKIANDQFLSLLHSLLDGRCETDTIKSTHTKVGVGCGWLWRTFVTDRWWSTQITVVSGLCWYVKDTIVGRCAIASIRFLWRITFGCLLGSSNDSTGSSLTDKFPSSDLGRASTIAGLATFGALFYYRSAVSNFIKTRYSKPEEKSAVSRSVSSWTNFTGSHSNVTGQDGDLTFIALIVVIVAVLAIIMICVCRGKRQPLPFPHHGGPVPMMHRQGTMTGFDSTVTPSLTPSRPPRRKQRRKRWTKCSDRPASRLDELRPAGFGGFWPEKSKFKTEYGHNADFLVIPEESKTTATETGY